MKLRKPKQRVYRKLDPSFASNYISTLRVLSRKHKEDDVDAIGGALRVLRSMSSELFLAGRGELWIPQPHKLTGRYPIMEKIPYTLVRRAIRKNTSEAERARAWGVVASSAEPFVPLFARRPGSLTEAQRRRLLSHVLVSVPFVKGRHPALLGKKVPGQLGISDVGTRSIIPIKRMAPEDWEKGFTMKKFSMSEDLAKSIQRTRTAIPRVPNPKPRPSKVDLKDTLKKAVDLKVKLEPERREYAGRWSTLKKTLRTRRARRLVQEETFLAWAREKLGREAAPEMLKVAKLMRRRPFVQVGAVVGASTVAGLLGHKRRKKELVGKKKPLGVPGHLLRAMTLGPPYYIGRGVAEGQAAKVQRQYNLSETDMLCYEDGVREWLRRTGRRTQRVWLRTKRWVKREVLPTVARDVTLGVASLAHTELGLRPTTVDLLPVQSIGLKRELQPHTSMALRRVVGNLQERLVSEVDPVLRKGLEKGIADIATELMIRRSMF